MSRKSLALAASGGAIVGFGAAYAFYYSQYHQLADLFITMPFERDASYAHLDVKILRDIRDGKLDGAVNILEHQLDGELFTLQYYHDAVRPSLRNEAVYSALDDVRAYRTEVPSPDTHPLVQAAIKRALDQRPQAKDAR
jgi:hypothetical protein